MTQVGPSPQIELVSVAKRYGEATALSRVDLSIQSGEFVTLLGPSGCGKSTTLRLIAGLDLPSEGRILFAGEDVTHRTPASRNIAMVFQSYALYPHFDVGQNISLPLAMARLSRFERLPGMSRLLPAVRRKRAAIAADVKRAADAVSIGDLLNRRPSQLSGGQKQRVALARALVREPAAFLLDEPLSNLDARLRVATRDELVSLHKATGRTFIYVTHDQSEAMTMSDRIAVFRDGTIVQTGTPEEIHDRPVDTWVARFVGERSIALVDASAASPAGHLAAPFSALVAPGHVGPITIGLRPEAVTLDDDGPIEGIVERLEYLGTGTLISVRAGDQIVRALIGVGTPRPSVGEVVRLGVEVEQALLFGKDGERLEESLQVAEAPIAVTAAGAR